MGKIFEGVELEASALPPIVTYVSF